MIKPIVKDTCFLSQKSVEATKADLPIIRDLQDTLNANREHCVGMAANMIGHLRNIIIFALGPVDMVMVNPQIIAKSKPYEVEESCLSLEGVRKTTRYRKITVSYQDAHFKKHTGQYQDFLAQVIQHEIDHLHGIII